MSQLQVEPLKPGQLSNHSQGSAGDLGASVEVEGSELVAVLGQGHEAVVGDADTLANVQDLEVGQSLGEPGEAVVANRTGGQRKRPQA